LTIRFWLPLLALALPALSLATSGSEHAAIAAKPPSSAAAPIALVADLNSGQILFARAADHRLLPASMTKAMTALVAFDLIDSGKLREIDVLTVRPETAAKWAGKGTTLNLRAGERVCVHDLLMGTTTVSANDAAVALGEGAGGSLAKWTAMMNTRAAGLGMAGSHFASANGFPDHGRTYVTANDLIRLARALIEDHPQLYRRYFGQKTMSWRGARLLSHDPLSGVLPGADGIKTGHSFEAGFNFLGSVMRDGRRVVLVVGSSPTEPARAAAARSLGEWSFAAWDNHAFLVPNMVIGAAKVQGGDVRSVRLGVPRSFSLAVPHGLAARVTGTIHYLGPLRAPLAKGQGVARLVVHLEGQPDHELPLVTLDAVATAGPIDRIVNGLLGLFS
jgi:D-alanyl-D-alanine carboxypeptidase (penicillin-binding protein 5/6)